MVFTGFMVVVVVVVVVVVTAAVVVVGMKLNVEDAWDGSLTISLIQIS